MKVGFFEESEGQKSATRLVFIIGTFWAMALCTAVYFVSKPNPMELAGAFGTLIAALGGIKVIQKPFEGKNEPDAEKKSDPVVIPTGATN